ncbi:MAG: hypothetical protein PVH41_10965, partial [Anaerolineae bacterium]
MSARGVLRVGDKSLSQYRFRHILFQKYLHNGLDPVERTHLHEKVGTTLERLCRESAGSIEGMALQLARHFQAAGMVEKAGAYFCEAGERARQLYGNREAVDHFRR